MRTLLPPLLEHGSDMTNAARRLATKTIGLSCCALLLAWPSLYALGQLYSESADCSHGFMIPLFAIPLLMLLVGVLTRALRALVSTMAEPLIRLCGISIFREVNVMHLANMSLRVDDACS